MSGRRQMWKYIHYCCGSSCRRFSDRSKPPGSSRRFCADGSHGKRNGQGDLVLAIVDFAGGATDNWVYLGDSDFGVDLTPTQPAIVEEAGILCSQTHLHRVRIADTSMEPIREENKATQLIKDIYTNNIMIIELKKGVAQTYALVHATWTVLVTMPSRSDGSYVYSQIEGTRSTYQSS